MLFTVCRSCDALFDVTSAFITWLLMSTTRVTKGSTTCRPSPSTCWSTAPKRVTTPVWPAGTACSELAPTNTRAAASTMPTTARRTDLPFGMGKLLFMCFFLSVH